MNSNETHYFYVGKMEKFHAFDLAKLCTLILEPKSFIEDLPIHDVLLIYRNHEFQVIFYILICLAQPEIESDLMKIKEALPNFVITDSGQFLEKRNLSNRMDQAQWENVQNQFLQQINQMKEKNDEIKAISSSVLIHDIPTDLQLDFLFQFLNLEE